MAFMMQIYDRLMVSSSWSTLTMHSVLIFLLPVMGGLEWMLNRILILTSNRFEQLLNLKIYDALFVSAASQFGRDTITFGFVLEPGAVFARLASPQNSAYRLRINPIGRPK